MKGQLITKAKATVARENERLYRYEPDYVVHPGEILKEHLSCMRMTKAELAHRCGLTVKHVSEIISGNASITPDTAVLLGKVLGVSADVWINLQALYDGRLPK